MPRSRIIRPDFYRNEHLVLMDPTARLMAAGLVCWADREGRLKDRPLRLKMEMFPADNIDVDALLTQMHDCGYITRYQVDGQPYIQIDHWDKHQSPHARENGSCIPPMPGLLPEVQEKAEAFNRKSGVRPVPGTETVKKNKNKKEKKNKNKEVVQAMMEPGDPPDKETKAIRQIGFDRWWSIWPRKIARKKCEAIWHRIKPDADYLIADTENRIKNDLAYQDPKYIMHPSTYLNGERHRDEVQPIPLEALAQDKATWMPSVALRRNLQIRFGADLVDSQLEKDKYYSEDQFVKHMVLMTAH